MRDIKTKRILFEIFLNRLFENIDMTYEELSKEIPIEEDYRYDPGESPKFVLDQVKEDDNSLRGIILSLLNKYLGDNAMMIQVDRAGKTDDGKVLGFVVLSKYRKEEKKKKLTLKADKRKKKLVRKILSNKNSKKKESYYRPPYSR